MGRSEWVPGSLEDVGREVARRLSKIAYRDGDPYISPVWHRDEVEAILKLVKPRCLHADGYLSASQQWYCRWCKQAFDLEEYVFELANEVHRLRKQELDQGQKEKGSCGSGS